MIVGVFLRNYKNYANIRFIPVLQDINNPFSIYIGNNGVGKSAVLEAIDVVLNKQSNWNTTQGNKKNEAFICPVFLISRDKVQGGIKNDIDAMSKFFWGLPKDDAGINKTNTELNSLQTFISGLGKTYCDSHYLLIIGSDFYGNVFCGTYDKRIRETLGQTEQTDDEINQRLSKIRDYLVDIYSYIYIPIEESPEDILRLQNSTMQRLLNTDVLKEIENILNNKTEENNSILDNINKSLDGFIEEVNKVINTIDNRYMFAHEQGMRRVLKAKDIREKILEAYFPLRTLKVNKRGIEYLSSGEQRKAVIDIIYSTIKANNLKSTERDIIIAIDEPEASMHISNCYDQFERLEELSRLHIQIITTTHWYGYLSIAQKGVLHHLSISDEKPNYTEINTFILGDLVDERKRFPNDVELKSVFDLSSSILSYIRQHDSLKWLICEGVDDSQYLKTVLDAYKDQVRILPVGGCGNVVKLYSIFKTMVSEKTTGVDRISIVFLIDTDFQPIRIPFDPTKSGATEGLKLRRLQLDGEDKILLYEPGRNLPYSETEIEDCLNPDIYYRALSWVIEEHGTAMEKRIIQGFQLNEEAKTSRLKGDNACIIPKDIKNHNEKKIIIEFATENMNKYRISQKYSELCRQNPVNHELGKAILSEMGIKQKKRLIDTVDSSKMSRRIVFTTQKTGK